MAPKKSEALGTRLQRASRQELERRDTFGRAAIHLVTLLGRADLLAAVLKNPQCQASLPDMESGWTCLHYAIFYGRLGCARVAIEHDYALMKVKDRSGLTAMDLYHLSYAYSSLKIFPQSIGDHDTNFIQRLATQEEEEEEQPLLKPRGKVEDPLIWFDRAQRGGSDLYTFGSNVNYQLATGDSDDRTRPFRVSIANRRLENQELGIADRLVRPRIKDVKLSKNHSVVLTNETVDNLLIAGNGSRGRLGTGKSIPNYVFRPLEQLEELHITEVALSDDHTLALSSDGDVYSWGLNNYFQLGYQTEKVKEKTDTFSEGPRRVVHSAVKKLKVKGIACSRLHSCAFADSSLVLWGLNVGQMDFVSTGEQVKAGKLKGVVQVPRKIDFQHKIKQVVATDDATIVLLETNECHVLTNNNHLRFQIPVYKTLNNEFEFFRPTKFSKRRNIVKLVSKDASKIGILYDDGSVSNFGVDMFTKSSSIRYNAIWKPRNDHLKCTDVDIGRDGSIVIATKAGCVYRRSKGPGSDQFKFTKIDRVSKIVRVSCDSLFSSFAFIKDDVDQLPLELKKNRFLVDVSHLSPLALSSLGRKQSELVKQNSYEPYTVDFLHKPRMEQSEEEIDKLLQRKFVIEDHEERVQDPLLSAYKRRWSHTQPLENTFETVDPTEVVTVLTTGDPLGYLSSLGGLDKGHDLWFELDGHKLGVHRSMLFLVKKLQALESTDVVIGDVVFHAIDSSGVIHIDNLHAVPLIIMINLLYTGALVKIWEHVSDPAHFSSARTQTIALLKSLELIDNLHRPLFNPATAFGEIDNFDGDVLIQLHDGELRCWSELLKVRNAYFETLFSERWDDELPVLQFTHVRVEVFEVALKYIYGHEQLTLLDDKHELKSVSDLVNFCFELIELSDELLLFGLKDFCQLMIKDFIDCDNVLLILHHADTLNCQKLIGECLWFIYNNVDSLLIDPNYDLLSTLMIKRIDKYCRWLKRVNKVNPQDSKEMWYDGDSSELLRLFLNDKTGFNDIFLSSDDFVPLFDLPPKKEPKSPKLEPKQKKQTSPPPTPLNIRRPSTSTPKKLTFVDMSRKSSVNDSSAVLDDDDDDSGFQPVTNRRRRSSANTRRGSTTTTTSTSTPPVSASRRTSSTIATPSRPITAPQPPAQRQQIRQPSITEQTWPGFSSPSSWTAASPMGYSPISGTSSKLSFSTPRLSQKERKRMMKTETPTEPQSSSPWKITSAANSSSTLNSPSLLSAQEEALAEVSAMSTPSLKGIMHEEEHRLLEEKQVKSLAEVQQEEEFARWWEEESRRVQQQMQAQQQGEQKKTTPKNKKKYRPYRKQSVP